MRVTLIGAEGFVGSAFARLLRLRAVELIEVTRANYERCAGVASDVVVDAASNSRKYLAEEQPFDEFELSVAHRVRTLRDFSAGLHVHISSVDVYDDLSSPATTREVDAAGPANPSHYGFHKVLAEQLVRHHARAWLIARIAGMLGPGLRKNPVYDILHRNPLRIHPESRYQFMSTDRVAAVIWELVERGIYNDVFNICGTGLISPHEIARMLDRTLDLTQLQPNTRPRIVNVNLSKIETILPMPTTRDTVTAFLQGEGRNMAQVTV